MKCEYCGAELTDGTAVCPDCGNLVGDRAGEKDRETRKLTLFIVLGVVLIAIAAAIFALGRIDVPGQTTPTSPSATQPTVAPNGEPDTITGKGSYTVSDEQAQASRAQEVAWVGDTALTNGQLQVYYWMQYYYFVNQYGAYAGYFGLDLNVPLDMQRNTNEENITWQQFFLENALDNWHLYTVLADRAEKENFQISPELADYMKNLRSNLDNSAKENGFSDGESMIRVDMGPGCGFAEYENYLRAYYTGSEYYGAVYESFEVTDAEIKAHYEKNKEAYTKAGITEDTWHVDVRHILITPEGEVAADGTYSEEAWEAGRVKAQKILDEWVAGGATEESFAQQAKLQTADASTRGTGGLYTGVKTGDMVEEFDAWCFDDSRKPGDYGLVRTRYGYHIMYYVDGYLAWQAQAEGELRNEMARAYLDEIRKENPVRIDYSGIVLGLPKETK